ncbi:hypothetical protein BDU57DRAFT_465811 [Ampelomyces quisqualis]|uniref:Guanine nucleotide-exchange factor SEC12 n=1 Tax=Ampelomyces quisqualis TaxID=50730 RepID=A0A6A5QYN0_AMPQU|nr:hypothetical protein BDU57DRAFT_465811 [Ampelomyces quisqualis]
MVFAGNGSSMEERLKGQDTHFKAFEVQLPKGKPAGVNFLSRTQLFTPPKGESARKEMYQRLLKLSPAPRTATTTPNKRIGAIASGLAGDENEIVVFSATSNRPQAQDIIKRIKLAVGQEANDLDISDLGEGRFQVAYCLDSDVYIQDVDFDFAKLKSRTETERRKLYTVPHPEAGARKGRAKVRGIRWLSPKHLLLLANKPNRTGVELLLLHMYEEGPGSIVARKTLPSHVKAATDFDVALLDADEDGAYQVVVAVGGIDVSLSIYTIDYHGPARDSLSQLYKYATYDEVHPMQMTKVLFSALDKKTTGPQYLRLATTSLGNTISVETFETIEISGGTDKARHVIQTARTRRLHAGATYLVIAMVVAAMALMIQSLIDPEGALTSSLIPARYRGYAGNTFGEAHRSKRHAAVLNNADTPAVRVERRVRDLLHLHNPPANPAATENALVIYHDPDSKEVSTEVHKGHEAVLEKHTDAKRWDDLSKEDQLLWKKKLGDAGMWAVEEGETILKSIFFGQIGGLVGQVAQGVLG